MLELLKLSELAREVEQTLNKRFITKFYEELNKVVDEIESKIENTKETTK